MPHSNVKTNKEIKIMREAGQILAKIYKELREMIAPGVDEWEMEKKFQELCRRYDVIPACQGYQPKGHSPYPTGLCIGVNEECVHTIPHIGDKFKEGDLVNIDTLIKYKNMYVDAGFTIGVGKIGKNKQRLLDTANLALNAAIKQAKPGKRIGDISNTIQTIAEMAGFNVLREYTGHGVGRSLHEPPSIPCWGESNTGDIIEPGMTLAIEPLLCSGSPLVEVIDDDWETKMSDNGDFVQVEHTVLITTKGNEILTKLK